MPDSSSRSESLATAVEAEWAALLARSSERQLRFLRQLIPVFLSECPQLQEVIRRGIAVSDAAKIRYAAHTLKSSTSFFAGTTVAQTLDRLETAARGSNLIDAGKAAADLDVAMNAILPILADFAKT